MSMIQSHAISVYQLFVNNRAKSRDLISFPFVLTLTFLNFTAKDTNPIKSGLLLFFFLIMGREPARKLS